MLRFDPVSSDGHGTVLARQVEGVSGRVDVEIELAPTFDYARGSSLLTTAAREAIAQRDGEVLRLGCPADVERLSGAPPGLTAHFSVVSGERHWVWLAHTTQGQSQRRFSSDELDAALHRITAEWQAWAARCQYGGPHADLVCRSALVLKLLTYETTGAITAAPTTSLPEQIGGARNWDYRYVWLHDSVWILDGLMCIGYHDEAMAFWQWMERLSLDEAPQPPGGRFASSLYTVDGQPAPKETALEHLEG